MSTQSFVPLTFDRMDVQIFRHGLLSGRVVRAFGITILALGGGRGGSFRTISL